jgi:NADH:ubiquinone oxidoreductase subunit 6 (subunit J)
MVILNRNSIYSVISLIVLILGSCCILFLMKIEFLTFIILLIYIGAISVIFLFLIMMLNLNKQELKNKKKWLKNDYFLYIKPSMFFLLKKNKIFFYGGLTI